MKFKSIRNNRAINRMGFNKINDFTKMITNKLETRIFFDLRNHTTVMMAKYNNLTTGFNFPHITY